MGSTMMKSNITLQPRLASGSWQRIWQRCGSVNGMFHSQEDTELDKATAWPEKTRSWVTWATNFRNQEDKWHSFKTKPQGSKLRKECCTLQARFASTNNPLLHEYQSIKSINNNYMCMCAKPTGKFKLDLAFEQMHDFNSENLKVTEKEYMRHSESVCS